MHTFDVKWFIFKAYLIWLSAILFDRSRLKSTVVCINIRITLQRLAYQVGGYKKVQGMAKNKFRGGGGGGGGGGAGPI